MAESFRRVAWRVCRKARAGEIYVFQVAVYNNTDTHKVGDRVGVYYTTRELTKNFPEFFALTQLDGAVIQPGPGALARALIHPNTVATVYWKHGRALIALASWAKDTQTIHLIRDWKSFGLDPSKARLTAIEIDGYQAAKTIGLGEGIVIPAKGGCLLGLAEN